MGVFIVMAGVLLGVGCEGGSDAEAGTASLGVPESEYDLFANLVRNIDTAEREVVRIRATQNRVALRKAEVLLAKEQETLNLLYTKNFGEKTVAHWTTMVRTADANAAQLIASKVQGAELLAQFQALGASGHLNLNGRIVDLNCRNITLPDEMVARIANCPRMRVLVLKNTGFKDSHFTHLSGLTELNSLDLSENSFSGEEISKLSKMTRLVYLILNGTHLSNAYVKQFESIAHLKSIRMINIKDTRLNPDSYKKITRLFRLADVKY